jgi:methionyl-tRNA formyltransferase
VQVLVSKGSTQNWRRAKHVVDQPPVKEFVDGLDVPVSVVPSEGIKAMALPAPFNTFSASNMLITASFGHLIPSAMLQNFPGYQALNVHPSLLPRYRGAAPIQWAIANQDAETGITVQTMGARFDSGDILSQITWPLSGQETYEQLSQALQVPAAKLLMQTIEELPERSARARPQHVSKDDPRAPKLTRRMSLIDWHVDTAATIKARNRGFGYLYPLHTYALFRRPGKEDIRVSVQLHLSTCQSAPSSQTEEFLSSLAVGTAVYDRESQTFVCRCADSRFLQIEQLQQSGRSLQPAKLWRSSRTQDPSGHHVLKFVNE